MEKTYISIQASLTVTVIVGLFFIVLGYLNTRKISNNKYRLLAGPFKNFNALKSTYISLNNLGFESLNIYEE